MATAKLASRARRDSDDRRVDFQCNGRVETARTRRSRCHTTRRHRGASATVCPAIGSKYAFFLCSILYTDFFCQALSNSHSTICTLDNSSSSNSSNRKQRQLQWVRLFFRFKNDCFIVTAEDENEQPPFPLLVNSGSSSSSSNNSSSSASSSQWRDNVASRSYTPTSPSYLGNSPFYSPASPVYSPVSPAPEDRDRVV